MSARLKLAAAAAATAAAAAGIALYLLRRPDDDDDSDEEEEQNLAAGMLLLERAKENRALLPIAFLVHGAVKAAEAPADGEAAAFGLLAEHLEVVLLGADGLDAASAEAPLAAIAAALEQAVERMNGGGDELGGPSFIELGGRLAASVRTLKVSPGIDLDIFERATSAAAAAAAARVRTTVDRRRSVTPIGDEQTRLLEERNAVLRQQVAQMQAVLAASGGGGSGSGGSSSGGGGGPSAGAAADGGGLRPQEFLARFPLPADEAERRLGAVSATGQIPCPCADLDGALRRTAEAASLGGDLVGLMVTFMEDDSQRLVASICRKPGGSKWVSTVPEDFPSIPRKYTRCQHVVASGRVECLSRADVLPRRQMEQLAPTLAAADPAVATSFAPGGYHHLVQQFVAEAASGGGGGGGGGGGLSAERKQALALMASVTHPPTHVYAGAPVRLGAGGQIVGVLCAWFTGDAADAAAAAARRAALEREGAEVSSLVGRLAA